MKKDDNIVHRFLLATLPWIGGAGVVWIVAIVVMFPGAVHHMYGGVSMLGLVLSLSAFAGGLAASRIVGSRREVLRVFVLGVAYGVVSLLVLTYLAPLADYRVTPADRLSARYPLGPETPSVLAELRDHVAANPSSDPVFASTNALDSSPSHFEKQLQLPRVAGVLAAVLALLGLAVGVLTERLRSGVRHRTRWLIGLGLAFGFLAFDDAVRSYLRADLTRSGVGPSWLPLAPYIVLLALLIPSAVRRRRDRP